MLSGINVPVPFAGTRPYENALDIIALAVMEHAFYLQTELDIANY
jgi:hypothetical protein